MQPKLPNIKPPIVKGGLTPAELKQVEKEIYNLVEDGFINDLIEELTGFTGIPIKIVK